jgi:hypothetical protein
MRGVHNNGNDPATDVAVRFWWGNPAAGVIRDSGKKIGLSSVTIGPGQAAEVLCLTPWYPTFVNGGHECLVVEAATSAGALPNDANFNIPNNPQAAQRNLSVQTAPPGMQFHFAFEIHNASRLARRFVVNARQGSLDEVRSMPGLSGSSFTLPQANGVLKRLGFVEAACPSPEQLENAKPVIEGVDVGPNERRGFSLVGTIEDLPGLVHIEQSADGHVVGGLSVLVVPLKKERS